MPRKAAAVTVSEKQLGMLQELSVSRSEAPMLVQRAQIILQAHSGRGNTAIAASVKMNRIDVGKWRRRWRETQEQLAVVEAREPRRLRDAIRETLRDAPRAGCGGKFTPVQVTHIQALACEAPSESQRPITHWTHKELRAEILKRRLVARISLSHVGTLLRKSALQPHRSRMWINTTEKDPEVFQRQVEAVCETYLQAPQRHATDGTRTISVDEMTGLQALERAAPDQPMIPGEIVKREFEYIRQGTTTLIGNWDVVDGSMIAETLGPTRTEADFLAHVQQTVATDPDVNWVIVVDCLNIHWSASLVEWISDLCDPDRELGKKRDARRVEKPSQPPGVSVGGGPSHPFCVLAETQFLAQPD